MARDDNDQHRIGVHARVWRAGEQRAVVGGCLQTVFVPVTGEPVDADIERLMRAIDLPAKDTLHRR